MQLRVERRTFRIPRHLAVESGSSKQTGGVVSSGTQIARFSTKCFQKCRSRSRKYRGHFFSSENVSPLRGIGGLPAVARGNKPAFALRTPARQPSHASRAKCLDGLPGVARGERPAFALPSRSSWQQARLRPRGLRRGSLARYVSEGWAPARQPSHASRAKCLDGLPAVARGERPAFALRAPARQPSHASRAKAGGPGGTRTPNQTVMSRQL